MNFKKEMREGLILWGGGVILWHFQNFVIYSYSLEFVADNEPAMISQHFAGATEECH
jgi:hypothetical protein